MHTYIMTYASDHKYRVQHGDSDRVLFESESKSRCIAEAQRLNGYEPVDGDEQTYAKQRRENM